MPRRSAGLVVAAAMAAVVSFGRPAAPVAARPDPPPAFRTEGVAFLKAHCLSCHAGAKPKADLALDTYADDAALLKDRKTWTRVADVLKAGEMPPPKPRPAAAEVERFVQLVDDVFARHDRAAKPDPGRVTMRRLNRTEYNHTIRDLVGVDFKLAALGDSTGTLPGLR